MTDLHTHRGTVADRARAAERVRTTSYVAGVGAVVVTVGLTAALVPHPAAASSTTNSSDTSSSSSSSSGSSATSTAPSSGRGGGSVAHSGGS